MQFVVIDLSAVFPFTRSLKVEYGTLKILEALIHLKMNFQKLPQLDLDPVGPGYVLKIILWKFVLPQIKIIRS